MTDELRGETRALLSLARRAGGPTERDAARIRRALAKRLGVGALFATAGAATAARAAGATGALALAGGAKATGVVTAFLIGSTLAVGAISASKIVDATEKRGAVADSAVASPGSSHLATPRPRTSREPAQDPQLLLDKADRQLQGDPMVIEAEGPPNGATSHIARTGTPTKHADLPTGTRPSGTVAIDNHAISATNRLDDLAAPPAPATASAGTDLVNGVGTGVVKGVATGVVTGAATGIVAGGASRGVDGADGLEGVGRDLAAFAITEELRLIREAQALLHAHRAAEALARVEEHSRQFPYGALREEREASRVLVLCQLGRVKEAHTAAEHFFRETPSSPLAERVRAACPGADGRP